MDGDRASDLAAGDLERADPGHRLHGIAHGVGAQLGPALTPEILRDLGTVDDRQHLGDVGGARGDAAVVLAHAEDVVTLASGLLVAALDLTGLPQRHADL